MNVKHRPWSTTTKQGLALCLLYNKHCKRAGKNIRETIRHISLNKVVTLISDPLWYLLDL